MGLSSQQWKCWRSIHTHPSTICCFVVFSATFIWGAKICQLHLLKQCFIRQICQHLHSRKEEPEWWRTGRPPQHPPVPPQYPAPPHTPHSTRHLSVGAPLSAIRATLLPCHRLLTEGTDPAVFCRCCVSPMGVPPPAQWHDRALAETPCPGRNERQALFLRQIFSIFFYVFQGVFKVS